MNAVKEDLGYSLHSTALNMYCGGLVSGMLQFPEYEDIIIFFAAAQNISLRRFEMREFLSLV